MNFLLNFNNYWFTVSFHKIFPWVTINEYKFSLQWATLDDEFYYWPFLSQGHRKLFITLSWSWKKLFLRRTDVTDDDLRVDSYFFPADDVLTPRATLRRRSRWERPSFWGLLFPLDVIPRQLVLRSLLIWNDFQQRENICTSKILNINIPGKSDTYGNQCIWHLMLKSFTCYTTRQHALMVTLNPWPYG